MAWSLFWNKKFVFLIEMAPLEIDWLNFENS
jgi:hypothetical protein